ncbi:MAG: hypothetical protein ACRCWG_00490 [Sarcina sp.]
MKKGHVISLIIVVLVILGIGVVAGVAYFNKENNALTSKVAKNAPIEEISVKKLENSKEVIVNATGDKNINNLVIAEVLKENDIEGVEVDIKVNSEAYGGVSGSEILKACSKALNMNIPTNNYKLANILIASSTGLDMLDNKQNVYKVITLTNEHFEENYSNKGLFMGVPDKILNEYSPKIKNNDGANSLYVQMCIFLNQYYTNLNEENTNQN